MFIELITTFNKDGAISTYQGCKKYMQINIYVVKTELLKKRESDLGNVLNKNAFLLLETLKEELISLYGGLSVHPTFKGLWLNESKKVETDINEIWECLTDKATFETSQKRLNQIVLCIKTITKQKSQLVTLNPNMEAIYINENL